MSTSFLKEVAAERLPKLCYRAADIVAIKALSESGMVIAHFSDRNGYGEIPYAQVVAITEQGYREVHERQDIPLQVPQAHSALTGLLRSMEKLGPTIA